MSLLIDPAALDARRSAAAGPLAPLAASLAADLRRVLEAAPHPAEQKALLSRDGGRCPRDGAPLAFDPFSPHAHRCPLCGDVLDGERHHRWWVMGYQLWLAERAVHAAVLGALTGDSGFTRFAAGVIADYTEFYATFPNRDNVLGPTRLFFSTYLESIWLLMICIALDLLEGSGGDTALGGAARDRLIAPSVALIASYDEGMSNRQLWNNAALIAGYRLLGRPDAAERVVAGPSGLIAHMRQGLLSDGSWYEGENYHFFSHRALWYGLALARQATIPIPSELEARFQEGFSTPLLTALPDFTFPARRDSQFGVSLRQWRFAESCELGLVRQDDPRLIGALWELYERPVPRADDVGRWRSTAEAERNEPASALTRADLGWRSLLFARPELPALAPFVVETALLAGQGVGVFRRDEGRLYSALDYGHSGGGHGHPDRLNVLLAHGAERWLDDMGTGSYVDPSLHWYRSTLAHNAPLVNGESQARVAGVLRAFDERTEPDGAFGWIDALVPVNGIAPGVEVARTIVATPLYIVDQLVWQSEREIVLDLPFHFDGSLDGVEEWVPAPLVGGRGEEDGFAFLRDTAVGQLPWGASGTLASHAGSAEGWVFAGNAAQWWRATAPGEPGVGERSFFLLRDRGRAGTLTAVWSWAGRVRAVDARQGAPVVTLADRTRHRHARAGRGWRVEITGAGERRVVVLAGVRQIPEAPEPAAAEQAARPAVPVPYAATADGPPGTLRYELGEESYHRSEESWSEAGRPHATVALRATRAELVIDVDVRKSPLIFRPPDAPDPALDNDHPDIHSDGAQIYVQAPEWEHPAAWLAVPVEGSTAVRIHEIAGSHPAVPLSASWRLTPGGYALRCHLPLAVLGPGPEYPFRLDLVVNDMAPGRERRRGLLVLSGGGGWAYLRGERQDPAHALPFVIPRV